MVLDFPVMVPSTKRQICSDANTNNKRMKEDQDQLDKNDMAVDTLLPHLPDLIVHKIFRLIPTKLAVRSTIVSKQWASVWSLGVPLLDFDDEGDPGDHEDHNLGRRRLLFIDFVESCLKRCEKNKHLELDSFRLGMRYDCELIGAIRIDKWLSFAVERCVKELDMSIKRKDDYDLDESTYYCIPQTILNTKFLTSLNLEHVRIMETTDSISLPSLKTMSLKAVMVDVMVDGTTALEKLISMGCPSIELLSLASCSFSSSRWWWIDVTSSSLKSLQVVDCNCNTFKVEAENLESLTFASEFTKLRSIRLLSECVKLKYINIYAQHPKSIEMHGRCRENVKATIDTPNLLVFGYEGFVMPNDVISLKAQNPLFANILLNWDDEEVAEPTFLPPWTHFPTMRDFLQNFDHCNKVKLDIRHDAIAEVYACMCLYMTLIRLTLNNFLLIY